uniref:Uncharacterized protein n=1 Tax=Sphenodon punctatus TaxID=8508 RepID=A0A8D0H6S1_SPHPU
KATLNAHKEEIVAKLGNLPEVNNESNGAAGLCWKPIQIQLKCLRGVKDKVPKGHYVLKVSLCGRLGGSALHWSTPEEQQWAEMTPPVSHDGNFYNVEIYFDQSVHTVVPARMDVKLGMILLFELFLLRGTNTYIDRIVGWGVFPLCDNNFDALEGKFKCPFLRGHYDAKLDRFKKIENLISSDLDHWLCNLYFQVCMNMNSNDSNEQYCQGKSSPVTTVGAGDSGTSSPATSHLEELEKHRFSVCCHSATEIRVSRRITEHFYFGVYAVYSELVLGQWNSWDFWFIVLLIVFLWFVRLYLHYCSQWSFLQAISVPVTKFQFFPHTVELCYQNSLLHTSEELVMVVVGPLTLNVMMLLMVLMRWGCQQLFGSFPSFLSKFIMAMGLWSVLDPLAVFVVDAVLGRLTYSAEKPTADAAKLYWLFLRTEQSGIPGVLITAVLYTILFIISSTVLYLYFLRLHSEGWLLDVFERIHSDEATFFIPLDLEISNQELSYIMKKAEQWRGINGERRKVAVYDYIWDDSARKSGVSSCDLQHQVEISKSTAISGEITVHVSIYTVHLSGFQELYRHFLRLPDGAIVEVSSNYSFVSFQKACCQISTCEKVVSHHISPSLIVGAHQC